jgi:hypothetical protein
MLLQPAAARSQTEDQPEDCTAVQQNLWLFATAKFVNPVEVFRLKLRRPGI